MYICYICYISIIATLGRLLDATARAVVWYAGTGNESHRKRGFANRKVYQDFCIHPPKNERKAAQGKHGSAPPDGEAGQT